MTKRTSADLIAQSLTRYPVNTQGLIEPDTASQPQSADNAESMVNHLDATNAAAYNGQPMVCDTSSGLVVPGNPTGLQLTDLKTTSYQAVANELVKCDLSSGSFTVTAPANPTNNQQFGVKVYNDDGSSTITIDSGTANLIEAVYPSLGADGTTRIAGIGACVIYKYDATEGLWIAQSTSKIPPYSELWQATPIASMSALGTTIQWTFVPLFTGQVPLMATHAAGVFTFQFDFEIEARMETEVAFNLAGNNSDADYDIDHTYVGTGIDYIARIIDAFAHARSGSFSRSDGTGGPIVADKGDTLTFVGTSTGSGASDVSLDAAALVFSIG